MISRVSVSRRGLYLRLCILVQKSPSLLFSLSIFLSFFTTSLPLLYSCSPVPMIFASTNLPLFYSLSRFLWDMFSQVALPFILPLHFPLFFFAQVSPSFRIIFLLSFFFFFHKSLVLIILPMRNIFVAKGTVRGLLCALLDVQTELLPRGRQNAKLSLSRNVRCEFIECNC